MSELPTGDAEFLGETPLKIESAGLVGAVLPVAHRFQVNAERRGQALLRMACLLTISDQSAAWNLLKVPSANPLRESSLVKTAKRPVHAR
nr:hypothetical protein [Amycolatopsis thailandensis]